MCQMTLYLGNSAMPLRELEKIGVGSSVKFLTKQHGFVGNLLLGRSYKPETLISQVVNDPGFVELGIEGLHLFSFNQIDATVEWQREICAAATA